MDSWLGLVSIATIKVSVESDTISRLTDNGAVLFCFFDVGVCTSSRFHLAGWTLADSEQIEPD